MSHANPQPAEYEKAHSEFNTCMGCVGEHSTAICYQLPSNCFHEQIIWVNTRTPQQRYVAALEQDIG